MSRKTCQDCRLWTWSQLQSDKDRHLGWCCAPVPEWLVKGVEGNSPLTPHNGGGSCRAFQKWEMSWNHPKWEV